MAGGSPCTDTSPRASLLGASPASTLPKPYGRQPLARPSAPFSPARVNNLLEHALARARSQPPCSARAATRCCPRRRCQPLATCGGRRPGLAPERFPRDIWPCRRQQTGLYGAEAAGSFGRAGQGAHATVVHGCAMRHTAEAVPPRCPGHHKLAHERTDRYASQRSGRRTGQCSHAHTDAARLDCPRLALGCQATFWPPVGSATRSNGRCALPHLAAPQGAHTEGTGAAALCPCRWFCSPPNPLQRVLRIAGPPGGQRLCRSCQFLGRLSVPPWASSQHGHRPAPTPRLSFLSPCKASQCTAAGLLHQGQALQASVLADRARRPYACWGQAAHTRG